MTLVTFLGMIGTVKAKSGFSVSDSPPSANYRFSPELRSELGKRLKALDGTYHNMFPLLLESLQADRVVLVGTELSLRLQKELLRRHYPQLNLKSFDEIVLDDDLDFRQTFGNLNQLLEGDEPIVVDISHSFRHIPALMMVELIIENIKDPSRIQHILYARELQQGQDYEVVDLREYLTLANVSYALASFTRNYTVATTVRTRNEEYQALLGLLQRFSDHLLANSFEALLYYKGKEEPIALQITRILERIVKHPTAKPLRRYLDEIRTHMGEILDLSELDADERYYHFARLMAEKGYLLNAIVLLDEALAAYCLEGLRLVPELQKPIANYERKIAQGEDPENYNRYGLSNGAKNLVKYARNFNKRFANDEEATVKARNHISRSYSKTQKLRDLLFDCDNIRNNLAHGNSDQRLQDAREEIWELLDRYKEVCHYHDFLGRFKKK